MIQDITKLERDERGFESPEKYVSGTPGHGSSASLHAAAALKHRPPFSLQPSEASASRKGRVPIVHIYPDQRALVCGEAIRGQEPTVGLLSLATAAGSRPAGGRVEDCVDAVRESLIHAACVDDELVDLVPPLPHTRRARPADR